MQKDIVDDVHIGESVTPFQSTSKSTMVDKTASDFDNANLKVKKVGRLIEHKIYDVDIARYIPSTLDLVFHGMKEKIKTIEQIAHTTYKDKETLESDTVQKLLHKSKRPSPMFSNKI